MNIPRVERFWVPLGKEIVLGDQGYLADPTSPYGEYFSPNTFALSNLRGVKTLYLIGEPGLGKSTVVDGLQPLGDTKLAVINLKDYGTEESLQRALGRNKNINAWLSSNAQLELFLDSYDECAIVAKENVIPRLLRELIDDEPWENAPVAEQQEVLTPSTPGEASETAELPSPVQLEPFDVAKDRRSRLKLRVVCRSGSYLPSVADSFSEAVDLEPGNPPVFKLAPLRRSDVEAFVTANGREAGEFLRQVSDAGATVLAAIPLTLQLLFKIYVKGGSLPSSITEIYRKGMVALVEEPNEAKQPPDAAKRLAIAEELAFLSMGTGSFKVYAGRESDLEDGPTLWYGLLASASEGRTPKFTLAEVGDALCTGLFAAAGIKTVTWAHLSFAEFLAASFITKQGLSLGQIQDILVHPPTGHVFTPLQETAAWLASMHPTFLSWLVQYDPQCILRTDVSDLGADKKEAIVGALLEGLEARAMLDNYDLRDHYRALDHSGLAEQLRPMIVDPNRWFATRRFAIDVAEKCELVALEPVMLQLALTQTEDYQVRREAAHFIVKVGSPGARAQLRPLAVGEAGDDPNGELRGYGLEACWPDNVSLRESLAGLEQYDGQSFYGSLYGFFFRSFTTAFQLKDLPDGLQWILESAPSERFVRQTDRVRKFIVKTAIENLDEPGILELVGRVALQRLRKFEDLTNWDSVGEEDDPFDFSDAKRRAIVQEVIRQATEEDSQVTLFHLRTLCQLDDYPWIVGMAAEAVGEPAERKWARLALDVMYWPTEGALDALCYAAQKSPALAETYDHLLRPIELDSDRARELRHIQRDHERRSRPRRQPKKRWVPKRIHFTMKKAREDSNWFWQVGVALANTEEGFVNGIDWIQPDVEKLPGWKLMSSLERRSWSKLSRRYLNDFTPRARKWKDGSIFHPDVAGYRAIRWLLEKDETFITGQPTEFFKQWAPTVGKMMEHFFGEIEGLDKRVIELFFARVPANMVRQIKPIVTREAGKFDHPSITNILEPLWNPAIAKVFPALLKKGLPRAAYETNLLCKVLHLGSKGARSFAVERLRSDAQPGQEDAYQRRTGAIAALLSSTEDGAWDLVFPVLQANAALARDVLEQFAHSYREPPVAELIERLGVEGTVQFFRLICRAVPYIEDPDWHGGFVSPVQNLRMYRDEVHRYLVAMGTAESHAALKDLAANDPPIKDMTWSLLESEANLRRNSWTPNSAVDLLNLASKSEGRIVNSEAQLLDVVLEALKEIQVSLPDEVRLLWNIPGTGEKAFTTHPKEEEEFSDYLKQRLDERIRKRGVILNREPQVRRGDKTDIHVEAALRNEDGTASIVSVTIEVKCSWNGNLKIEMKDKLLDRYLDSDKRNVGIYLVGWYESEMWKDDGNKRKVNQAREVVEPLLREQAQSYSTDEKTIVYVGIDCSL